MIDASKTKNYPSLNAVDLNGWGKMDGELEGEKQERKDQDSLILTDHSRNGDRENKQLRDKSSDEDREALNDSAGEYTCLALSASSLTFSRAGDGWRQQKLWFGR